MNSYDTEARADATAISRRVDGRPETAADKRFFDLRESGYNGPIDQDGYAVTTGDAAAALRRMAERRGEDTSWFGSDPPGPRREGATTDGNSPQHDEHEHDSEADGM